MNKSRPETVNIIVIDDDLNNMKLISLYLSGCGYSVKSFSQEIEALNYLQGAESKISLIILDLMLTEISGYELCRRIRSNPRYRFTPILISSGLTDNKDKNAAMEAGADDFISKPIDRQVLITRVRSLIRIQTLYDELIEKNEKLEYAFNKLKSAQNTLINNEKFVSIGAMAQGLTHEIYNPLTIIGGNLERVSLKMKNGKIDNEFLNQIIFSTRNAVKRCAKIVEALETYSAEKINSIERTCVNDILKRVATLFAVKLKMMHSINIIETYDEAVGEIDCDQQALQQAFMHLMNNAAESIGENGEITISTALSGDEIIVRFSDTGAGFKEEDLSKAFDPFYTTKLSAMSAGLGLAVVSGVAKLHNSTVEIKNNPSGGACVSLKIPAGLRLDEKKFTKNLFNL